MLSCCSLMHGPMSVGSIEPVTDFQMFHAFDKPPCEFSVDTLVNRNAACRGATLAGGAKAAPHRAIHRQIKICVVHHDDDVFAAHFERHMLEVRRARFRNDSSHRRRTGKTQHGNFFVLRKWSARVGPVTAHEIDHAFWQTCFRQCLDQVIRRQRRIFGRLQDHGISRNQRRHHFPRRNRHRKIPRRDHSAHADRLPHTHGKFIGQFRWRSLAKQPPPFSRHVIGHVNCFLHVAARLRQDFAHLARHVLGKFFLALHQQLRRAVQNLRALGCRHQPPRFVRLFGGIHGGVHVFGSRRHEHSHQFIRIRRIAVFVSFAAACLYPFPIDEILVHAWRCCRCHTAS